MLHVPKSMSVLLTTVSGMVGPPTFLTDPAAVARTGRDSVPCVTIPEPEQLIGEKPKVEETKPAQTNALQVNDDRADWVHRVGNPCWRIMEHAEKLKNPPDNLDERERMLQTVFLPQFSIVTSINSLLKYWEKCDTRHQGSDASARPEGERTSHENVNFFLTRQPDGVGRLYFSDLQIFTNIADEKPAYSGCANIDFPRRRVLVTNAYSDGIEDPKIDLVVGVYIDRILKGGVDVYLRMEEEFLK